MLVRGGPRVEQDKNSKVYKNSMTRNGSGVDISARERFRRGNNGEEKGNLLHRPPGKRTIRYSQPRKKGVVQSSILISWEQEERGVLRRIGADQ